VTITGIIVLAVIILAFLTFALALAWGERQTRNISDASFVTGVALPVDGGSTAGIASH
jgi:hypothetical protein